VTTIRQKVVGGIFFDFIDGIHHPIINLNLTSGGKKFISEEEKNIHVCLRQAHDINFWWIFFLASFIWWDLHISWDDSINQGLTEALKFSFSSENGKESVFMAGDIVLWK
jgi:hypothetical protein